MSRLDDGSAWLPPLGDAVVLVTEHKPLPRAPAGAPLSPLATHGRAVTSW